MCKRQLRRWLVPKNTNEHFLVEGSSHASSVACLTRLLQARALLSHKLRNKTSSILETWTYIMQVLQSCFIKYQFLKPVTGKGLKPTFFWPLRFSLYKQASGNQLRIRMLAYSFKVRYINAKGTGHAHLPASTSLPAEICMRNQSIIRRWASLAPASPSRSVAATGTGPSALDIRWELSTFASGLIADHPPK